MYNVQEVQRREGKGYQDWVCFKATNNTGRDLGDEEYNVNTPTPLYT